MSDDLHRPRDPGDDVDGADLDLPRPLLGRDFVPLEELPPDPDEDALPDEIAEAEGPLTLTGIDRETGEVVSGPVEKIDLARGFADARRIDGDDDPA